MVPPIQVDSDAIANAKYQKLRDQIHRARTWQTVQRAIDTIQRDIVMAPFMCEELLEYAERRMPIVRVNTVSKDCKG